MENICRTCLRVSSNLISLYDNKDFIDKIETISSIQLMQDDNYPSSICDECATNVRKFYNFRKVIINSDRELREVTDKMQRDKMNNEMELQSTEMIDPLLVKDEPDTDDLGINAVYETELTSELPQVTTALLEPVQKINGLMRTSRCKVCGDVFSSRYKLYNHIRTTHFATVVCNICGKSLKKENLKKHIRLHSEGPTSCKICGKVVKHSESLRGHMLIHRGLTFTCETCGKVSKVRKDHIIHMRTHLDPEAKCKICNKKYKHIKKHMLTHTREKGYLCHHCNQNFISLDALQFHLTQQKQQKVVKRYTCELCLMEFIQKRSLNRHLRSKHNIPS